MTHMKYVLDDIDKQILQILTTNSNISYQDLQRAVLLSPSQARIRVKRLQENGIIQAFTILIDTSKIEGFQEDMSVYHSPCRESQTCIFETWRHDHKTCRVLSNLSNYVPLYEDGKCPFYKKDKDDTGRVIIEED